jgi:hypothetical protein
MVAEGDQREAAEVMDVPKLSTIVPNMRKGPVDHEAVVRWIVADWLQRWRMARPDYARRWARMGG